VTRVILTNRQTGQELPEAALRHDSGVSLHIWFDGTTRANVFYSDEWNYREVRAFRNGDVLRRRDRDDVYVQYMYVTEVDGTGGRWLNINSDGLTQAYANPAVLNDPEWELV
jgi:hypothetical protein